MPRDTVYIASQAWNDKLKEVLEQRLPDVNFNVVKLENASSGNTSAVANVLEITDNDLKNLQDARILITDNNLIPDFAYSLPKLQWLQGTFAGVNIPFAKLASDLAAGRYPAFAATRFTGDSYGQLMFELCLSYIISKERGFREFQKLQPTKNWAAMKAATPAPARILSELKITIIGAGAIGVALSQLFKSVGCSTAGYSKSDKSEEYIANAKFDQFSTNLDEVIVDADYVISILPHTPQTIGFLNKRFDVCKSSPVFINLGRGSVISEDEIIRALDNGKLSLAVLDVYETEPLPTDSKLWTHEKVAMTPHMA